MFCNSEEEGILACATGPQYISLCFTETYILGGLLPHSTPVPEQKTLASWLASGDLLLLHRLL